ncbi:MAG: hypothetical protein Q9176_003609 [Flavoplaca citrina]
MSKDLIICREGRVTLGRRFQYPLTKAYSEDGPPPAESTRNHNSTAQDYHGSRHWIDALRSFPSNLPERIYNFTDVLASFVSDPVGTVHPVIDHSNRNWRFLAAARWLVKAEKKLSDEFKTSQVIGPVTREDSSSSRTSPVIHTPEQRRRAAAKKARLRWDEMTTGVMYLEALQHNVLTLFLNGLAPWLDPLTLWLNGTRYNHSDFHRYCLEKVKILISTVQVLPPWYVAVPLLSLGVVLGGLELRAAAWHTFMLVVIANLPSMYRWLAWLEDRLLR